MPFVAYVTFVTFEKATSIDSQVVVFWMGAQVACEVQDFALASANVVSDEQARMFFGGSMDKVQEVIASSDPWLRVDVRLSEEDLARKWLRWFLTEDAEPPGVTRHASVFPCARWQAGLLGGLPQGPRGAVDLRGGRVRRLAVLRGLRRAELRGAELGAALRPNGTFPKAVAQDHAQQWLEELKLRVHRR